jgi:hypothetical protein
MDLVFNVIFVPGTVRYLRLAIMSLVEMSDFRYRLVSNGLGESERRQLREFCDAAPRLEYREYPDDGLLAHGDMLNRLLADADHEYFCFMDSDIFACERFGEEVERHLAECDVFSSCLNAVVDEEIPGVGYGGTSIQTPTGLSLATTYFAIYRREPLQRVIRECGIGFERHRPSEGLPPLSIPAEHAAPLADERLIDTGKLMNICAACSGLRFRYEFVEGLLHVGGMSAHAVREPFLRRLRRSVHRILGRPFSLDEAYLAAESRRRKARVNRKRPGTVVPAGMNLDEPTYLRSRSLRRGIAVYFIEYMRSLFDGGTTPLLNIDDEDLMNRIAKTCLVARRVHASYEAVWSRSP